MILSSPVISSTFKTPVQLKQLHGSGKIIIERDHIYLQTGTERVALDPSLKNVLSDGEAVKYTIDNETIYLTPVKNSSASSATIPDISSLAGNTPSAASRSLPTNVFTAPQSLPSGYFLFTNVEEAMRFLDQIDNEDLLRQIEKELQQTGIIAIKIDRTITPAATAIIIPFADISNALQSLKGLFSSELLRSLPTGFFNEILFKTGTLSIDLLNVIDTELVQAGNNLPSYRAGSSEAQAKALMQWLQTALTTDLSAGNRRMLFPSISADALAGKLATIFPMMPSLTNMPVPDIEPFILNESAIPAQKPDLLKQAFKLMGYDLENHLSGLSRNTAVSSIDTSVKSIILHLLSIIPDTQRQNPAAIKISQVDTPSAPLQTDTSNGSASISQKLEILQTIRNSIITLFPDHESGNGNMSSLQLISGNAALSPLPGLAAATSGNAAATIPPLQHISSTIRSIIPLLAAENMPAIAPDVQMHSDKMVQRLLMAVEQMDQLDKSFVSGTTEQSGAMAPQPGPLPAAAMQAPQLPAIFRTITDSIDETISFLRFNANVNTSEAGAAAFEHNPEHDSRSSNMMPANEKGAVSAQTLLQNNLLKQSLTAALDTLESLQMLSRQITTADGTQQIIALPIKFGEQISEINVRFLNYHKKNKMTNKGMSHFSVDIDVAPPSLGSIHSHLDYHKSQSFKITVEFEKKGVYLWFEKNREAFFTALQPVFQNTITVDFRLVHKNRPPLADFNKSMSGIIDMKA